MGREAGTRREGSVHTHGRGICLVPWFLRVVPDSQPPAPPGKLLEVSVHGLRSRTAKAETQGVGLRNLVVFLIKKKMFIGLAVQGLGCGS